MRQFKLLLPYLCLLSGCVIAPSRPPASPRSPRQSPAAKSQPSTANPARRGSNAASAPEGTPATNNAANANESVEIRRLKTRIARDPRDAQLHYLLAVHYARANDAASSAQQLHALAQKNWTQGIDLHDFRNIASDARFRTAAAQLRSRHQKAQAGSVAATLQEKGTYPEGIAWDQKRNQLYIGDAPARDIIAVQPNGQSRHLKVSGQKPMYAPLGMRVDPNGKILWVASAAMELMQGYTPSMAGHSALVAIDLDTSKIVGHFETGNASSPSLFNDVQPLGDGRRAVVTDSKRGTLYIASLGKNAMGRMLPDNSFEGPNGITLDPVGERLFIADSLGLSVIGVESSKARRLKGPSGTSFGGVDGLSWWKGSLVGVQNAVGDLRIWTTPVSGEQLGQPKVLSAGDPRLGAVTTIATNSQGIWFIADTQFHSYGPDGKRKAKAQLPPLKLFHIPL